MIQVTEFLRLADQTSVATQDIEQIVKEMQSSVSSGVMGMEEFNDEIRKGTDEVRQVASQLSVRLHSLKKMRAGCPTHRRLHAIDHYPTT